MMLSALLLLLGAHGAATPTPPAAPWPTKAWPESAPAAQGMDRAPLDAFDRELAAGRFGYVDSMLVIRNGRVVYEKTYDRARDYDAGREDDVPRRADLTR